MYIFASIRNLDWARSSDAIEAGARIVATMSDLTGLPYTMWFQSFAPTGPALVFTTRIEHLEELDRSFATLMGSSDYQDQQAELDEYLIGSPVQNVIEPVAGTPPAELTPFVSSVQATATNGHLRAAMHWGADVAERFGSAMGVPTMFARGLYGHYGTLFWASYYDDVNAIEGTQAKMAADEMLQAVVDEGAHNVQPGAVATVMRKLT